MTIDQIMNGARDLNFPGLLPLVQDYLRNIEVDTDTMCTLSRYWIYLQKKSNGQRMTNARFIRNFVTQVCTKLIMKSRVIQYHFKMRKQKDITKKNDYRSPLKCIFNLLKNQTWFFFSAS